MSPRNLSLASVGVVLFLVSVPRVHSLALQDNQRDAQSAVRALFDAVAETPERTSPAAADLAVGLEGRLRDVRYHPQSGLIQRHGYLFEVSSAASGDEFVRAWPVSHGETGGPAFVMGPKRTLRVHPNAGALWSGPSSARPTGEEPGWRETHARR